MLQAKAYLGFTALMGTLGLLSNPDFYILALGPLVCFLIVWDMLEDPRNKKLLLASYLATAIYSFSMGRLFFDEHRLNSTGVILVLLALPVLFAIVLRIAFTDSRKDAA